MCITETQAEKLFGSREKPKAEGCGVFACVFPHKDPSKVVKITRDPSDVGALLKAQGLPRVPKVFGRHKLASYAHWTNPRQPTEFYEKWERSPEPYALVVERLKPLPPAERRKWNQRIERMAAFERQAAHEARMAARGSKTVPSPYAKTQTQTQPEAARGRKPATVEDMAKAVCPKRPSEEATTCRRRVVELTEMIDDLKKVDVDWTDVHAGNIGVDSQGRWKALDLGASTSEIEEAVPELAGPRRRRRRRR